MKLKIQRQHRAQSGDTLIEVTIAIIIIGVILFSAYTLGTKAFQLGQNAKERAQATQLLQVQAEGLRAMRDAAASWVRFCGDLEDEAGDLTNFHLERDDSNRWDPEPGGDWDPSLEDPEILGGLYRLTINAEFEGANCVGGDPRLANRLVAQITIKWDPVGFAPEQESTLYTRLTDPNLLVD